MPEQERPKVDERVANMNEAVALPRLNGELLFASPWEARAFGLAVALNESGAYAWSDFSQGLARTIASEEALDENSSNSSTYYERWLATLETLVIDNGLITPEEIETMMEQQARLDDHDHDHHHDHDDAHVHDDDSHHHRNH